MSKYTGAVCSICGGRLTTSISQQQNNADGDNVDDYVVNECDVCGTGITAPMPSHDILNELYSKGIYQNEGGRGGGGVSVILDWLQRSRIRKLEKYLRGRGKLLDVGCGKGRFVTVASRMGWDAIGQDFSCSQAGFASSRSGAKIWSGELAELPNNFEFDAITAWHVLEHTLDPEMILKAMKSHVKDDGLVVIEVPNYKSLQSKLGKGRWFQLDVPRHLWHFTPKGLEQLLSNNGFKLLRLRTFSPELGIFGMLQTLLNIIGFEPQWIFRYMKRTTRDESLIKISLNLAFATFLILPATILEVVAAFFKYGGVIRCTAVLKSR